MVALVRAGVTATCSSADKPRYGDLDVDSNLPDARIALGGPDENPFTAAVLAEADPAYTDELKRQLYATGAARVWVPAAAPLATTWLPGADLRGVRALPVLVIAGGNGLDAAVASVVDDLADAEIAVDQQAPAELGAVRRADRRGAQPRRARLRRRHRRHPAHVADAVVHRLAVRGVDRPAAAPHRTRRLELPAAALDAHVRLRAGLRRRRLAIGRRPGPQRGVLTPATGGCRKAQRRRRIAELGLAAGDRARRHRPTRRAEGGGQPAGIRQQPAVDPTEAVAMRLVETSGATTDVAITSGLHRVSSASRVNLLEEPRLQKHRAFEGVALHGYEIATMLTRLNMPQRARRRPHAAGARGRGGAAAVCAVLAAQPRPGAARRTARRRAPAPAGQRRRAE